MENQNQILKIEENKEIKDNKDNKDNNELINKEKEETDKNETNKIVLNNIINNEKIENNLEIKEPKKKIIPITKYSSLPIDLFSLSYITEYKCSLCGLIPSPESANEEIDSGNLFCEECIKKNTTKDAEPKENKISNKIYRKIKVENKVFYKVFKNLNIKCPYKCEWKGVWADLGNHLNVCKYGIRYCKYQSIGCEFLDDNLKVIEHEKNNDKYHLEMALKYIKTNKIVKKKIKFVLGEKCKTTVHPHEMTYMTSYNWNCDGRDLPHGCYSVESYFNRSIPRYRCIDCDFDLCDKCIVHYAV